LALEALEDRTVPSVFNAPLVANLPATAVAEAAGHFRNSGPLDVVTANANGTVSVLLGNGDGSFQSPVNLAVGATPDAVAVGDFLANGWQDLVTANADGTVSVFLSNPDGTFQSPQSISVGSHLNGVAVGDFLGNGHLDIVAVGNGTVSVLVGNGDGTFGSPINTQVALGGLRSVAVGDFNTDGKPDIAVETSFGLDVLRGNGDGTFQLTGSFSFSPDPADINIPADSVAVADLRGSGKQDLVVGAGGQVKVFLGNGDGSFQSPTALGIPSGRPAVVVGDFTGDGKPDIVTLDSSSVFGASPTLTLFQGDGDGTFQQARTMNSGAFDNLAIAGDFRGDGKLDLATATGNQVSLLLGNGDGTFTTAPTMSASLPNSVAAGDFTGSGRQDLVVADEFDNVQVLLNNGDGTFRAGQVLSFPHVATGVLVGQFTGSGHEDIALFSYDEHAQVSVYLGNGDGTFQAPRVFDLLGDTNQGSLVAGHFTGDGNLDLAVVYDQYTSTGLHSFVKLLRGNGDGTFQDSPAIQVADDSFMSIVAADLRGNGKLDLVTASTEGDVTILLGNGDGTFQSPVIKHVSGGDFRSVAVGDFNGDGRPDLVVPDFRHGSVDVLLGNGDGTFQDPVALPVGLFPTTVVVGDFFGDGKLSVAAASGNGTVSVLRGNGDGTFQGAVNYLINTGAGASPSSLVVGNFTGRGMIDLATANRDSSTITVLLNQGNSGTVTGAPTLQGVVLNDGTTTAPVTSLNVTLGPGITLDPGAIRLQGPGGSVSANVATSVVGGNTVATVTFPSLPGGALPAGSYTLTVVGSLTHNSQGQTFTTDATTSFTAEDIVPDVESVMVNDGSTPDAPVTSLTVTFNEVVSLDPASFAPLASDGTPVDVQVSSSVVNGRTVAVLSFGAALADGSYALTIRGSGVQDSRNHTLATDFETDFAVSGGLVAGDGILFQLPE
jgi:hypothetical protein